MAKIVVFGNSGAGKSTLAKRLAEKHTLAHLDLDTIAWKTGAIVERQDISISAELINNFITTHQHWVIEGCYSDLLALATLQADEAIFLNLPVSACVANAKNRPWEPHKYESKKAQDANLGMLIAWIEQYTTRQDTFSKVAHEKLFENFQGKKTMLVSNEY